MTKRQEAALITRQNIIEATRTLLNEKSPDEINMEEITNRAGVARGTFYVYFKRKEDVISAIAMEQYDLAIDSIMRSTGSAYEDILEYLKKSAEITVCGTLAIAQQWMKGVCAPLDGETRGTEKYAYDRKNIFDILNKAINSGEISDKTPIEIITSEIVDVFYGAVAVWCITGGESDLIRNVDEYCENGLKSVLDKYEIKK